MASEKVPMTQSGFCLWPGNDNGHQYCKSEKCICGCHKVEPDD